MSKNVGVSSGCPWKNRRYINEMALVTDKLHTYAEGYDSTLQQQILTCKDKSLLNYNDFKTLGQIMVERIVFNDYNINDDVFNVFQEANSVAVFYNPYFQS